MNNITVFTPTFNRAGKLKKLYESLCRQTCQNFEWMIIDDGSTDNTEEVVKEWIKNKKLNIQLYTQANCGMMRAHNRGVKLCSTKDFGYVDSDDYLIDEAMEIMENYIPIIDADDTKIGILFLRKYVNESDNIPFNNPGKYIKAKELYDHGFKGETTLLFKTHLLREFPFPVVDGEKYITPNISYDLIDQKYRYLYISKAVTICEYNSDGITLNRMKILKYNPCGYVNYYNQRADLYGKKEDRQRAYMCTFFIKDKKLRAEYRNGDYSLTTRFFGFLRYLKNVYKG